jgi:hypothetical protein
MSKSLSVLLALGVLAMLALTSVASAGHLTDPRSRNVVPMGHLPWPTHFSDDFDFANDSTISDIAFWGNYAIQGSYSSFRFVDISDPNNPVQVSNTPCGGQPPAQGNTNGQGDITISPDGNILVRSQDSARVLPGNDPNLACTPGTGGGLAQGWEGLQIFDTSNKANPQFVKAVFTDFGSHTHTQYHDKANNRLIIYVSRSGTRQPSTGGYGTTPTNPYGGQNWPEHHRGRGAPGRPAERAGREPLHPGRARARVRDCRRLPRRGGVRGHQAPVRRLPPEHDPVGHH